MNFAGPRAYWAGPVAWPGFANFRQPIAVAICTAPVNQIRHLAPPALSHSSCSPCVLFIGLFPTIIPPVKSATIQERVHLGLMECSRVVHDDSANMRVHCSESHRYCVLSSNLLCWWGPGTTNRGPSDYSDRAPRILDAVVGHLSLAQHLFQGSTFTPFHR